MSSGEKKDIAAEMFKKYFYWHLVKYKASTMSFHYTQEKADIPTVNNCRITGLLKQNSLDG